MSGKNRIEKYGLGIADMVKVKQGEDYVTEDGEDHSQQHTHPASL